jgi:hypothetical protein
LRRNNGCVKPPSDGGFRQMQRSNHERKGRRIRRHRNPREHNPCDPDTPLLRRGQALRVRCRKINDQPDHGECLVREPPDAEPTHLNEAGEGRGRTHQQPASRCFDLRAVISDEPSEGQLPARRSRDEIEREARLT